MLKIYKKNRKDKELYLTLSEDCYSIHLYCVDSNGLRIDAGLLLSINKSTKKIEAHSHVDKRLGFDLDIYGRVIV